MAPRVQRFQRSQMLLLNALQRPNSRNTTAPGRQHIPKLQKGIFNEDADAGQTQVVL